MMVTCFVLGAWMLISVALGLLFDWAWRLIRLSLERGGVPPTVETQPHIQP